MSESEESTPMTSGDPEINELLGLFDVPAFARRGQDLEYSLSRLDERCRRQRNEMLDPVRMRLRQWARAVTRPDDWAVAFAAPIEPLWPLCQAEPPVWSDRPANLHRGRVIARELQASVSRFNRRWTKFLEEIKLESVNRAIDQYNRYYVLEKECVLGSPRLAARHFTPRAFLTVEGLLATYPVLPVPELIG